MCVELGRRQYKIISFSSQYSAASRLIWVECPSTNRRIGNSIFFALAKAHTHFRNSTNVSESIQPFLVAAYVASGNPERPTSLSLTWKQDHRRNIIAISIECHHDRNLSFGVCNDLIHVSCSLFSHNSPSFYC